MLRANEDIEKLIVRSLDGELTPDEEHDLNRMVIRDPEARKLYDDYREIDEMARTALGELRHGQPTDLESVFAGSNERGPGSRRAGMRFHRGWLMIPGAIAAALLATFIPQPVIPPGNLNKPSIAPILNPLVNSDRHRPVNHVGHMQPVGNAPRTRSDRGRELIGVVGDDGNLYWIEVQRTRTIRVPASLDAGRSSSDWM